MAVAVATAVPFSAISIEAGRAPSTGAWSNVTVLSVLVEATLEKPPRSMAALASTLATTVPAPVMPVTETV